MIPLLSSHSVKPKRFRTDDMIYLLTQGRFDVADVFISTDMKILRAIHEADFEYYLAVAPRIRTQTEVKYNSF